MNRIRVLFFFLFQDVSLYGSTMWRHPIPRGTEVKVAGMSRSGLVHRDGFLLFGCDGKAVNVSQLQFADGKMIQAFKYGQEEEEVALELTAEETAMEENIKAVWAAILGTDAITADSDFFKMGASSMQVTRSVLLIFIFLSFLR